MNDEHKFKLQAHLDGELSKGESREVANLLNTSADAKAFFTELQFVKNALHGNEPEIKLPESREFYWSKIQKQIERQSQKPASAPLFSWWKPIYARFAGGFAAMCALLLVTFISFNGNQPVAYYPAEIEGNGEDMGSITYHSDTERMTVVYLFDREQGEMVDSKSN